MLAQNQKKKRFKKFWKTVANTSVIAVKVNAFKIYQIDVFMLRIMAAELPKKKIFIITPLFQYHLLKAADAQRNMKCILSEGWQIL
jgi:hypothetical protein